MTNNLAVFGLGKLGCSTLACLASKSFDVIGCDINSDFVDKINEGISPIFEPGVDELIRDNESRIIATEDPTFAILNSDVSIVIVPTPSTDNGSFTIEYVNDVVRTIGKVLKKKNKYHLVVITSTVLPGDMDTIISLLEETSGKKCIVDFGVCYNPDFIAIGSVVNDLLNPDMILIGETDSKSGEILESIHRRLVDNSPIIHRMSMYNAELAKIALNAYCTMKITFANTLAEICENMPKGDVNAITNAIGDDSRVGRKIFKGGISYGGPCFPRDNRAFAYVAEKFGVDKVYAGKTDQLNNYYRQVKIPNIIEKILIGNNTKKLAILGLTYKKDTNLVEESASIYIIKTLLDRGIHIMVYDPAGMSNAQLELNDYQNITYANSAIECIAGKSVCFLATPWDEFSKLTNKDFLNNMKNPVVIDSWNVYNFSGEKQIEYIKVGVNR